MNTLFFGQRTLSDQEDLGLWLSLHITGEYVGLPSPQVGEWKSLFVVVGVRARISRVAMR